jgi:hypothetical protein
VAVDPRSGLRGLSFRNPVIGVEGVETAADVMEYDAAGAMPQSLYRLSGLR